MIPQELKEKAFELIHTWKTSGRIKNKNLRDLHLAMSPGINNDYLDTVARNSKFTDVVKEIKEYFREMKHLC